jgi:tRNA threonylcarbamoyladenosine biosynthesis protein TsaB
MKPQSRDIILSFDSAGKSISVAVANLNGQLLFEHFEELRFGHAARLMPAIDQTLSLAGVTYKDLALIATTRGPGGFTGLRVGLATAKTLAQALSIPVLGVSSFDVNLASMSPKQAPDRKRLVIIDSHRNDLYFQWFNVDGTPIGSPSISEVSAIKDRIEKESPLVLGNGIALFADWPLAQEFKPDAPVNLANSLASLVNEASHLKPLPELPTDFSCEPIYLRSADVTLTSKT